MDTMNLDGETNLKEKSAVLEEFTESDIRDMKGTLSADAPNELLDYWEAAYVEKEQEEIQCDIKNLLLRGSTIRNTDFCFCMVANTGMETKIMMNQSTPPHKVSAMMRLMNRMLYTVFFFQIIIVLAFTALSVVWQLTEIDKHGHYLNATGDTSASGFFS